MVVVDAVVVVGVWVMVVVATAARLPVVMRGCPGLVVVVMVVAASSLMLLLVVVVVMHTVAATCRRMLLLLLLLLLLRVSIGLVVPVTVIDDLLFKYNSLFRDRYRRINFNVTTLSKMILEERTMSHFSHVQIHFHVFIYEIKYV